MNQFWKWTDYLVNHASDADNRRSSDPNEKPKHFIDIDNYPEFKKEGNFSQTFDEAIKTQSREFVFNQGILPWTTLATFNSLESCFKKGNWKQAEFFAADLGHYVADGHMPFHITKNYDGQLTGNTGIHSRYESTMISKFEDSISYIGKPVFFIENPETFIFFYLNHNYVCIDSIIDADNTARKIAGNNRSDAYYDVLWGKTKQLTNQLFANASQAFASLVYTAWVNAGSPKIESSYSEETINNGDEVLRVKSEGLLKNAIRISYTVSVDSVVNISVYDQLGNHLETILNATQSPGIYSTKWKPVKSSQKTYLVIMKTENNYVVKKITI